MEHVKDSQLLDLLGGHLPETEHRQVMDHLDQCECCRTHWQELSEGWEALGHGDMDCPDLDMQPRIMAQIRQDADIRWYQARSLLKLAASVLIAASVGHVAGRLYRAHTPPTTDQQIVQAMHLGILLPNSATGWSDPLLQGDESGGGLK